MRCALALLLIGLLGCVSLPSIQVMKRQLELLREHDIHRAELLADKNAAGCSWFIGYEGPAYIKVRGRVCATKSFEIVFIED